ERPPSTSAIPVKIVSGYEAMPKPFAARACATPCGPVSIEKPPTRKTIDISARPTRAVRLRGLTCVGRSSAGLSGLPRAERSGAGRGWNGGGRREGGGGGL